MNRRLSFCLALAVGTMVLVSCNENGRPTVGTPSPEEITLFSSSDTSLQQAYEWAKAQALYFAHDDSDSVGYWYEAALPNREAFCMRDVSHQIVGAQVLGLQAHNKNMLHKFAQYISESKDWCSYWEINRYDRPAPVDYANDKEFWYNLDANFDVTNACLKMYEWTGDEDYLSEEVFANFYQKTFDCYVPHWQLDVEHIMIRPELLHAPEPFDRTSGFHVCRGLPSYVENFSGMTVSLDLVASICAGFRAYSNMLELKGNDAKAAEYAATAEAYRKLMENQWWNEEKHYYNTFYTAQNVFFKGEGVPFALWYGVITDPERLKLSLTDILSQEWNVENLSYFPSILYRYGYNEVAYDYLMQLSTHARRTYPEASYGWMEALVGGYMGLQPKASKQTVATLLHAVGDDKAEVGNVPVWDGCLSLRHDGHRQSTLLNQTGRPLTWTAKFYGHYDRAKVNGKKCPVVYCKDASGQEITVVKVSLPDGNESTVKVL